MPSLEPIVLFRPSEHAPGEFAAACRHCTVRAHRCALPPGSLVYGRYSVLPFYAELESDLVFGGSTLVNTHAQHEYIAGFHYYADVAHWTFPSWTSLTDTDDPGPFVVKGRTNSRKHQWSTRMYAADRPTALAVAHHLQNDMLLGTQGIIYRRYEPLRTFEVGINGLPFTNEWRLFYLGTRRLAHGYYWSLVDQLGRESITDEALDLGDEIAQVIAPTVNFFVLDLAETEAGDWKLVEINDAQMSGTSLIDLDELYANLAAAMRTFVPV